MHYKPLTLRQHYIIRLNRGEEVFTELNKFCQDNQILSGSLSGIGAADQIELAHYSVETKQYSKETFTDEHEVTNLTGIITDKKVHIHATIANNPRTRTSSVRGRQFQTWAGHLSRMMISGACEIHLIAGAEAVGRIKDEETGLELLDI